LTYDRPPDNSLDAAEREICEVIRDGEYLSPDVTSAALAPYMRRSDQVLRGRLLEIRDGTGVWKVRAVMHKTSPDGGKEDASLGSRTIEVGLGCWQLRAEAIAAMENRSVPASMLADRSREEFHRLVRSEMAIGQESIMFLKSRRTGPQEPTLELIALVSARGNQDQSIDELENAVRSVIEGGKFSMDELLSGTAVMETKREESEAIPQARTTAPDIPEGPISEAYTELISSTHWREANAARDKLAELGEGALPAVLAGCRHEKALVRRPCYELLRSRFGDHPDAIAAITEALQDTDSIIVVYSAFHLGEKQVHEAEEALRARMADGAATGQVKYAAATALARLGDPSVLVVLLEGVCSEDHYARYYSNMGMKALCGKDLTDFGYSDSFEGDPVTGPAVIRPLQRQPIEVAKWRAARWNAVLAFLEWLQTERPSLYKEVETVESAIFSAATNR